jgi:hypothetical protein
VSGLAADPRDEIYSSLGLLDEMRSKNDVQSNTSNDVFRELRLKLLIID